MWIFDFYFSEYSAGSQVDQERDLEGSAAKRRRMQAPSNFEQSSTIDGMIYDFWSVGLCP